ncbi:hypothetical protein N657DRAFT_630604 [Parathielavia appendiculata]|uniref:Uncharacterized protein n=1 Tax=Parathielavia appendiculata TaxID=2587402 RepID=A0AAN6UB61_9PEZI|nr:hypothetical protein N657DRAFT_630604 [Parathielavia appendiculata]
MGAPYLHLAVLDRRGRPTLLEGPYLAPFFEPLRIRVIQETHDSTLAGYLPTESKQQYYCPEPRLTSSYDLIKRCVSLVQAIWAIFTAYRARGDQLEQYGYAAFGLTVVPYAVMSIINLTAQILNPDYPCMFVIETPTLARARLEGRAVVQGTIPVKYGDDLVGEEENNNDEKSQAAPSRLWTWARKKLSRIFAASDAHFFPDASQISRRISSPMERGFTMSWLVIGIMGAVAPGIMDLLFDDTDCLLRKLQLRPCFQILVLYFSLGLSYGVPALGGMVVVGNMIHDFGIFKKVCNLNANFTIPENRELRRLPHQAFRHWGDETIGREELTQPAPTGLSSSRGILYLMVFQQLGQLVSDSFQTGRDRQENYRRKASERHQEADDWLKTRGLHGDDLLDLGVPEDEITPVSFWGSGHHTDEGDQQIIQRFTLF